MFNTFAEYESYKLDYFYGLATKKTKKLIP